MKITNKTVSTPSHAHAAPQLVRFAGCQLLRTQSIISGCLSSQPGLGRKAEASISRSPLLLALLYRKDSVA
jgi:hypothetical protein